MSPYLEVMQIRNKLLKECKARVRDMGRIDTLLDELWQAFPPNKRVNLHHVHVREGLSR